jgi:hypothetical protein
MIPYVHFATIEGLPVVGFADRLFVPRRDTHIRPGSARAAASSLAFGAGGFSSRSGTRRLSLSSPRVNLLFPFQFLPLSELTTSKSTSI